MTCIAPVLNEPDHYITSEGDILGPDGWLPTGSKAKKYRGVYINRHPYYVHRLVAEAFIPNPENKPQVGHWDGDGENNRVDNLHWVTQSENEDDKRRHGRLLEGDRSPRSKLASEQVREIRKLREAGTHVDDVARRFGVSKWTVYDACNPKRQWKSVEHVW